jgi:hypothetical protein
MTKNPSVLYVPLSVQHYTSAWRGIAALWLASLAGPASSEAIAAFENSAPGAPGAPWRVVGLPGQRVPATRFELAAPPAGGGERALRIESRASYAMLVHELPPAPPSAQARLRWRWRVDEPVAGADLRAKAGDDTALRVCALFDAPLEALAFAERARLQLARALSGQALPSATLCYVWDAGLAPDTVLANVYSARVRYWVLGPARLGEWSAHERSLAADYRRAFADEARGPPPPLVGIGVGADSDNTGARSLAWLAGLSFAP